MAKTDPLQTVLDELTAANTKLGRTVASGDLSGLDALSRAISALEQERNRLLDAVAKPPPAYRPSLSARDRVVKLLRLTGVATSNRLLSDLSRAQFLDPLDTAGFSTLRRDELRAWVVNNASGDQVTSPDTSRTTILATSPATSSKSSESSFPGRAYVVPALSHDRFTAVRGALALSEWPIERRIVAPASLRVDLLRAAIAVTEKAADEGEGTNLLRVVNKLASGLGVSTFKRDLGDLCAAVQDSCRDELVVIEAADMRERAEAADRARVQLDAKSLLFGTQLAPLTSRGAPRKTPKKSREAS